jgi:hypothetical protein
MEGVTSALNILGSPFMQDAYSGFQRNRASREYDRLTMGDTLFDK